MRNSSFTLRPRASSEAAMTGSHWRTTCLGMSARSQYTSRYASACSLLFSEKSR